MLCLSASCYSAVFTIILMCDQNPDYQNQYSNSAVNAHIPYHTNFDCSQQRFSKDYNFHNSEDNTIFRVKIIGTELGVYRFFNLLKALENQHFLVNIDLILLEISKMEEEIPIKKDLLILREKLEKDKLTAEMKFDNYGIDYELRSFEPLEFENSKLGTLNILKNFLTYRSYYKEKSNNLSFFGRFYQKNAFRDFNIYEKIEKIFYDINFNDKIVEGGFRVKQEDDIQAIIPMLKNIKDRIGFEFYNLGKVWKKANGRFYYF